MIGSNGQEIEFANAETAATCSTYKSISSLYSFAVEMYSYAVAHLIFCNSMEQFSS